MTIGRIPQDVDEQTLIRLLYPNSPQVALISPAPGNNPAPHAPLIEP
ncbi:MAG: hypothetical protein K2W85_10140 [Phycisphaerales bacterium]|nr:hypothetical protein [Phycisphaerales bacterium]